MCFSLDKVEMCDFPPKCFNNKINLGDKEKKNNNNNKRKREAYLCWHFPHALAHLETSQSLDNSLHTSQPENEEVSCCD